MRINFKFPLLAIAVAIVSMSVASDAFAARKKATNKLSQVCSSVVNIPSTQIYKSIASKHITDARASSTSFIGTTAAPSVSSSCLLAYDGKGNQVHSLGIYQRGFGWAYRFYGGYGCGDHKTAKKVAAAAKANTGSSAIYIKTSTSKCVKIPNANACYNSAGC